MVSHFFQPLSPFGLCLKCDWLDLVFVGFFFLLFSQSQKWPTEAQCPPADGAMHACPHAAYWPGPPSFGHHLGGVAVLWTCAKSSSLRQRRNPRHLPLPSGVTVERGYSSSLIRSMASITIHRGSKEILGEIICGSGVSFHLTQHFLWTTVSLKSVLFLQNST